VTKLVVVFRNYSKAPNAKVLIMETLERLVKGERVFVYQDNLVLKWLINFVIVWRDR